MYNRPDCRSLKVPWTGPGPTGSPRSWTAGPWTVEKPTCETKYEWLWPYSSWDTNETDYYSLWPEENYDDLTIFDMNYSPNMLFPLVQFIRYYDYYNVSVNNKFAIVYSTAHRYSFTPSTDPWFATDPLPSSEWDDFDVALLYFQKEKVASLFNNSYWVRDRRPPLSCTERANWTYDGATNSNLSYLTTIRPKLHVSHVLVDIVQNIMTTPIIFQVGQDLQQAALRSQFNCFDQFIDAGASKLTSDMEALAWAAYISTRNMLQNTAGAPPTVSNFSNIFLENGTGTLRDGSGDFVITSANVTTISLPVLIAVPAILAPGPELEEYLLQHMNDLHSRAFQKMIDETLSPPCKCNDACPTHGRRRITPPGNALLSETATGIDEKSAAIRS
ncbi:hypothetical protein RUND412_010348 [Rhizina undulata]